jgi:hypothetical protein
VASAAATYLVTDILSDNNARVLTFGLDSALALHAPVAVKTGTSKDLRDNWCIGYSDRYTVGVWVGNASGEPMHDVSGVSGAAPVWRVVMQQLHGAAPARRAALPSGVVRYRARFEADLEPPRDELALLPGKASQQQVWFKHREPLPDDPVLHVCALAYMSDLTLLGSANVTHPEERPHLMVASLDHAIWFLRPFRADEWLLYDQSSPSACGGRALTQGKIFNQRGDMVAAVMQEGLTRYQRGCPAPAT